MRICLVSGITSSYSDQPQADPHTLFMAQHFTRLGHDVKVLSTADLTGSGNDWKMIATSSPRLLEVVQNSLLLWQNFLLKHNHQAFDVVDTDYLSFGMYPG